MSVVKAKVKVLKVLKLKSNQGENKLLQVTTFCCWAIFHLREKKLRFALSWFAASLRVCGATEQMEANRKTPVKVFLPAGEEVQRQPSDGGEASDQTASPSAGHEQLDIHTPLWAEGPGERSELSPLERHVDMDSLRAAAGEGFKHLSGRSCCPSVWRVDSHSRPHTVNSELCLGGVTTETMDEKLLVLLSPLQTINFAPSVALLLTTVHTF